MITVNAICAKCTSLQTLEIHDNEYIQAGSINELVSLQSHLTHLVIDRYFYFINFTIFSRTCCLIYITNNS